MSSERVDNHMVLSSEIGDTARESVVGVRQLRSVVCTKSRGGSVGDGIVREVDEEVSKTREVVVREELGEHVGNVELGWSPEASNSLDVVIVTAIVSDPKLT